MPNKLVELVKYGSRTIHSKVRDNKIKYVPKNLDGCVLYLPMDEKTINLSLDHSGNNYHGTIYGAVEIDGKINKGLYFDGIDDYVNCGNINNVGTGSVSLIIWFYALGDITYGAQLIGKQEDYNAGSVGYGLYYRQDNKYIAFSIQDGVHGARIYRGTYNYNTWYCVAGVYNSTLKKLTLYVNGNFQKELINNDIGNINNSLNLRLGYSGQHAAFKGRQDEARVFNRALTNDEVRAIYEQEL